MSFRPQLLDEGLAIALVYVLRRVAFLLLLLLVSFGLCFAAHGHRQ